MRIYHEVPVSLQHDSLAFNDGDYCLVHLLEENQAYREFFQECVKAGRSVILDNSVFELGESFDSNKFKKHIYDLKPTEYIIPDAIGDCDKTIQLCEEFITEDVPPGIKIGVVQGKTYSDMVRCYKALDKHVDKIAFSFGNPMFNQVNFNPDRSMNRTMARVWLLTNLLNEGVINLHKPHHLLGCNLPIEFMFYRQRDFFWLESVDTSSPIVHGLKEITYDGYGLLSKDDVKLADLIEWEPSDYQYSCVMHNVQKFRQIVKGT